MQYSEFRDLVNNDVRDATSSFEAGWLREPDNIVAFMKELKRLELTVSTQLEMSENAWRALPPGEHRNNEETKSLKASVGRSFFRDQVRKRIAEVEYMMGPDMAPVTRGQLRATLEAVLDAVDPFEGRPRPKDAVKYVEMLLDIVDPLPEEVDA